MSEPRLPILDTRITFIGAGNMASALFGGMIAQGWPPGNITATDPSTEMLSAAQAQDINTSQDNQRAVAEADVVVLAVKPQVLKAVLSDLAPALAERAPLLISIAAGIGLDSLQRWAGPGIPIVRCMPNTPALVQTGATGLFAAPSVSADQKHIARTIMNAVGLSLWLDDEAQLDAVTAVSGSGPAYFFSVMEAMIDAGQQLGLSAETASQLTVQTALGAALMAQSSDVDARELRHRVTSPGGTTEQALLEFEQGGLSTLFERAMRRCAEHSVTMARELGQD